jgi:hypothetical protein
MRRTPSAGRPAIEARCTRNTGVPSRTCSVIRGDGEIVHGQ